MHSVLQDIDWVPIEEEGVALLADLIRLDTTNPPGNETPCAAFVGDYLRACGLEPEVLESAPGRGNVVARLPGGDEPPLLLNGHFDVVPADEDRWTHPPFAGEITEGWLWGRGAVDMKNMVAMRLVAMRLLAQPGVSLRRDVIFAGVADEEAGCWFGSAWLTAEHPDNVRAGCALGEVGGFTLYPGDGIVYPVQIVEKGVRWLRATARGTSGYGSVPRSDNVIVQLPDFLARVGRSPLPVHISEPFDRFVHGLGASQKHPARAVLGVLVQPRTSRWALKAIRDPATARLLAALLRNTVNPTITGAGNKSNVIPGIAEAELDGRIAVGSTAAVLVAEVRRLAGPDIDLEVLVTHPPHEASADTDLFSVVGDVVEEHHAGSPAVPSVIPGFNDAHHWASIGATCYGFGFTQYEPGGPAFADLFHADDERILVAVFKKGLRMLVDTVFRFCAS